MKGRQNALIQAQKKAAHLGRPEIAEDFDSLAGRRMLRPDMN
jgi:hypothetical protein